MIFSMVLGGTSFLPFLKDDGTLEDDKWMMLQWPQALSVDSNLSHVGCSLRSILTGKSRLIFHGICGAYCFGQVPSRRRPYTFYGSCMVDDTEFSARYPLPLRKHNTFDVTSRPTRTKSRATKRMHGSNCLGSQCHFYELGRDNVLCVPREILIHNRFNIAKLMQEIY